MLRAQFGRISLLAPRSLVRAGLSRRGFGTFIPDAQLPPVPVLRPTIWALATTATIYLGCAIYDVRRDVQKARDRGLATKANIRSYEDLVHTELQYSHIRPKSGSDESRWQSWSQVGLMLASFNDAEKFLISAMALNIGLFGANFLAPSAIMLHFSHIPALSPNYTLLTSLFGHSGIISVGLNTLAILQLAPQVTRLPVFEGNGSHFAAFYLSAGIFSRLGDHLATTLPTRTYRFNRFLPSSGATGIFYAMMGAFATMHWDAHIGIVFMPGTYEVKNFIAAMVLLETFGLFVGIPYLHWQHGLHLAGLAAGSAYTYFDGQRHIWRPTCKFAFNGMRRFGMLKLDGE